MFAVAAFSCISSGGFKPTFSILSHLYFLSDLNIMLVHVLDDPLCFLLWCTEHQENQTSLFDAVRGDNCYCTSHTDASLAREQSGHFASCLTFLINRPQSLLFMSSSTIHFLFLVISCHMKGFGLLRVSKVSDV